MWSRASRWIMAMAAAASWAGCYYDVDPVEPSERDASVPDLGQDLASFDANTDALRCANGNAPFHAGELTEAPIDRWGAAAIAPLGADSTTSVSLDTTRVAAGASSLRLTTANGAAGLFYPATRDANFDLGQQLYVSYSITADDSAIANDPGWRGAQPHLFLVNDPDNYFEYVPTNNRLPRTASDFMRVTVPLMGGYGWTRNRVGDPTLAHVRYLAITFETWGAGFSVWLDDLVIGPRAFADCSP